MEGVNQLEVGEDKMITCEDATKKVIEFCRTILGDLWYIRNPILESAEPDYQNDKYIVIFSIDAGFGRRHKWMFPVCEHGIEKIETIEDKKK